MKKFMINFTLSLVMLGGICSCADEKCPANNGGYIELKKPTKGTRDLDTAFTDKIKPHEANK